MIGRLLCRLGFHDWFDRDPHQWPDLHDWECGRCRIAGGDGDKPPSARAEFERQNRVAKARKRKEYS